MYEYFNISYHFIDFNVVIAFSKSRLHLFVFSQVFMWVAFLIISYIYIYTSEKILKSEKGRHSM